MTNAGSGVAATGTLNKYRGGQCATCMYQMPTTMGNDGGITITFTSPTAATVQLPNGRMTQIQPEAWVSRGHRLRRYETSTPDEVNAVLLESLLTCPHCGGIVAQETMPTDVCLYFYE